MDLELQKKQKAIVEALISLLPTQSRKSSVPMAFPSSLLKSTIASSISTSCRADLERRIGLQLDQATLEDILIPASSNGNSNHSPINDTDVILRIFSIFLNLDKDEDDDNNLLRDEGEMQSSILKVSKLLDNYLAEVALDSNLTASRFIALAELLPDHARLLTDGHYRAVDIFLKVHQNIKDSERYRLCKTIDSQKLSQEACSHAAQNERLLVQMAVQVLYFEQIRLRNAVNGGHNQFFFGSLNGHFPQRSSSGAGSGAISPRDNYASVRRENRELKLEVARMRMRLTDLEKDHVSMKQELVRSHPANKLFKSFAKKLRKLNALFRINSINPHPPSKANSESDSSFQSAGVIQSRKEGLCENGNIWIEEDLKQIQQQSHNTSTKGSMPSYNVNNNCTDALNFAHNPIFFLAWSLFNCYEDCKRGRIRQMTLLVPLLQDLCLAVLAKNSDAITSIYSRSPQHRLSQMLCDSRKMNGHVCGSSCPKIAFRDTP
ncbi:hypothetical protein Ancab_019326 [Ancistrocladus abbreviatus]